ncbi:MAG: hypothetical protein ACTHQM_08860 [Thermoanaerobaculia bacterium]
MRRLASVVATLLVIVTAAKARAGGDSRVSFVPWKVVPLGVTIDAPLTLFWVPATSEELRRSPLLTSDALNVFSARCVAMRIIRFDDVERLEALEIDERPIALLVDANGDVLARVDATQAGEVERIVREALDAREREADAKLDEADRMTNVESAKALYRSVVEQRCVCPRQARDAQRALKKLKK